MPLQNDLTSMGNLVSDKNPLPVTQALSKYESRFNETGIGSTTANVDRPFLAAPGVGKRYVISAIQVSKATAAGFIIKSGASNVIWHGYAPANGMSSVTFPFPVECGENEAIVVNTATANTDRVCIQGYIVSV